MSATQEISAVSMDPSMIQSLLVQQLGQGRQQPGTAGGGMAGPQMQGQTSGANLTAQVLQKAMLMKALQSNQQGQQQAQATAGMPGANAQMAGDPQMQALQQSPQMNPAVLAQLQQPQIPPMGGVPQQ